MTNRLPLQISLPQKLHKLESVQKLISNIETAYRHHRISIEDNKAYMGYVAAYQKNIVIRNSIIEADLIKRLEELETSINNQVGDSDESE